MSMRALGIWGASGHGKVVAEIAMLVGWRKIFFYDDAWPLKTTLGQWEIQGGAASLFDALGELGGVVVAIGHNGVRKDKLERLQAFGAEVISLVHPAATVSASASLGAGTVVMAGAIINADARVGIGAILNTACSVDHDCVLGDAVHISPGSHLAGGVQVGDCSWIGIGASVRQGVNIGAKVIVGAGAAVVADVVDGLTVIGVPAKPMLQGED